jgi:hypothetical protein
MRVAGKAAGGTGLLVGPKAMIAQMQAKGLIPDAWDVAHFGALRGVDSFRSVSEAIVVSRQLPPPAEVERMKSIIFASDVQTVSDWYPIRASVRLRSDGTGRLAEFERHPDERVKAIRWLICEAEVQQVLFGAAVDPRGFSRVPSGHRRRRDRRDTWCERYPARGHRSRYRRDCRGSGGRISSCLSKCAGHRDQHNVAIIGSASSAAAGSGTPIIEEPHRDSGFVVVHENRFQAAGPTNCPARQVSARGLLHSVNSGGAILQCGYHALPSTPGT